MRSLETAISELVNTLGLAKRLREYDAVSRWNEIVGEQVARVSQATGIKQGVLKVRVNNAPWRNELQLLKREVIRKLNDALGEDVVKDIHFV